MLAELRSLIVKRGKVRGEKIFELTNFDVQEVSTVDHPANEQTFLLVKGALKMSMFKLKEILGDGAGEFVSKFDGDAGAGDGDGDAGAGDETGGTPTLKLSETVKAEALQQLGAVLKALFTVAKAVDGAEVTADGGGLPDDIKAVVRSSSQVLNKLLGEAAAQTGEGEQGKSSPAAKKVDDFAKDLDTLGGVIDNLREALGVKAPSSGAGVGDDAKGSTEVSPEVTKALHTMSEILKRQGAAISDMRERVGLPSALPAEGKRIEKAAGAENFDGWPMDMNEGRHRRR